jgi:hypothetical protein
MGPEGEAAPLVGGADSLPMERGQSRRRVGWQQLMLVVVCYVCVLCVVVVKSPFSYGTLLVEMPRSSQPKWPMNPHS